MIIKENEDVIIYFVLWICKWK